MLKVLFIHINPPLSLIVGANLAVDKVLEAFVLDYDIEYKRLDLTVDSNVVTKRKDIKSKNKKKV